ncbi:MAG TPA: ribonuclease Y [Verrucomicrobiales bacterium]|nr:ribonuclease Y [Verrucomicrobiales bacterium]
MSAFSNIYLQAVTLFGAGAASGYWLVRWKERTLSAATRLQADSILQGAHRDAENTLREAQLKAAEEGIRIRQEIDQACVARQRQVIEAEKRLIERESLINHQLENLVQEERNLLQQKEDWQRRSESLEKQREELSGLEQRRRQELQTLSRLSESEARTQFLKEVETSALRDASDLSRRIMDEAKARAEEKARRIISVAIQRYAGAHSFESSSATVNLPSEDLKGRIIGREGRNIRAFENATGVTVLIDDTPNAVVLSGFDPVRREVAREAMSRLLLDGRIHPTRIEEVVQKVSQEMDETIQRAGEEAVQRVGISAVHPEILRVLGRLRFRHSFSQNVLEHSIEVAHLMGLMASELGMDAGVAKRCGLLHDIGKGLDQEIEGPHAIVGADFIGRFGECQVVVNAVAAHHDEVAPEGPLAILVGAADAISASRPGARSETLTTYIKRVEDLERIGLSFRGVEKAFAVQAGRELRIMVQPQEVTDEEAYHLARQISRKIEEELQYPGQIRVTVLRETRCVEFAK